MDKSMNVDKISARQAAERWIAAHPEQVDSWRPK
jgi:ABC-type proline/glycine betaine transport system substrate-binding protein